MEKLRLEKAAIELFVRCFKKAHGKEYKLIQQQERPDAILEDEDGNRMGLEVTHLFHDELEVKMLLGRSEQQIHGLENFEDHIIMLSSLLEKKGRTGLCYTSEYPCSLLIRNASPIWTSEDFEGYISRIKAPESLYENVWLLTTDRYSTWSLIKLG